MQHESFQNQAVADTLNQSFISIKVDREERPDLDETYMTAVQLQSGRGGWPMSVFLTPDCKPIVAGTYFPLNDRPPNPGFLSMTLQIAALWKERPTELLEVANEFALQVQTATERESPTTFSELTIELIEAGIKDFEAEFDTKNGGFGGAPKFPPHCGLDLFLTAFQGGAVDSTLRPAGLHMALKTLERIAMGGIHDVMGGGFHRYSTDAEWILPHFEKMLSDNVLLLGLYGRAAHAVRITQPERAKSFQVVADGIVDWLNREMRDSNGLLCSALDADIGGHEGTTYVWSMQEISDALGDRDEQFWWAYQFTETGNFLEESTGLPTGKNVLCQRNADETVPREWLNELLAARNKTPQPKRDDKCITGWNGLAIAGLAQAGFPKEGVELAEKWLEIVKAEGKVPRFVMKGTAFGNGFLDDYAYLAYGFVELHRCVGGNWKLHATELLDQMFDQFYDQENGGFFGSSNSHERLFGRSKPYFDQPVPSANSIAIRVAQYVSPTDPRIRKTLESSLGWMERAPQATASLLGCLHEFCLNTGAMEGELAIRTVQVVLDNSEIVAGIDGWAEGKIQIEIPQNMHINGPNPPLKWLVPLKIEFNGLKGTVEYPDSDEFGIVGKAEIQFAVQMTVKADIEECEISVSFQACTDSECLLEETRRLALLVRVPHGRK